MRWSLFPAETFPAHELRTSADEAFRSGRFADALGEYAALCEALPASLYVRQRIGDSLVGLGDPQRGAQVYMTLARHAAHAGYPLRAVVAIKALAELEPSLVQLVKDVAALYGRDSKRLGRGARTSQPQFTEEIDVAAGKKWSGREDLPEAATQLAMTYSEGDWVLPEKLFPIPMLSMLGTDEFAAALHAVKLIRKNPGEHIIEQGKPGTSFYVLANGTVQVTAGEGANRKELAQLVDGAIFGEVALLSNAPRTASVTAMDDCFALEFNRDALISASPTARQMSETLADFARDRLLNNVMRTSGIFQPLDTKQRRDLVKHFKAIEVEKDEQIVKQGDPSTGLYVVLRGSVAVTREDVAGEDGSPKMELARLSVGDMFGEIGILNDSPTTASIYAAEPSSVLFLARVFVERLMEGVPAIREHIEKVGDQRIMETYRRVSAAPPAPAEPTVEDGIEIFI